MIWTLDDELESFDDEGKGADDVFEFLAVVLMLEQVLECTGGQVGDCVSEFLQQVEFVFGAGVR